MTADTPHVATVDGMRVAFGRVPQWDPANAQYLARTVHTFAERPTRTRVMHRAWLPVLDQQDVGACEPFQGVDALGSAPLYRKAELLGLSQAGHHPGYTKADALADVGFRWYDAITHRDEFPGAYSYNGDPAASPHGTGQDTGTSTLALCQYLKDQGLITRYEWITGDDPEALLYHLDKGGPDGRGTVILTGWGWTQSMCRPGSDGRITVKGPDIGGHATILRGYDRRTGRIRGRNHWRPDWGLAGEYEITVADAGNRMREGGDQAVIYR